MCRTLIGLVDEELTVLSVEEEERIFVAFFHNPATAILRVDFDFAVLAADALLGQKFVFAVVNLQIGVAVRIVYQGIHVVSTECIGDEIQFIVVAHILSYHIHIGHVIVIPVAVAIHPDAWPDVGSWNKGIPK